MRRAASFNRINQFDGNERRRASNLRRQPCSGKGSLSRPVHAHDPWRRMSRTVAFDGGAAERAARGALFECLGHGGLCGRNMQRQEVAVAHNSQPQAPHDARDMGCAMPPLHLRALMPAEADGRHVYRMEASSSR